MNFFDEENAAAVSTTVVVEEVPPERPNEEVVVENGKPTFASTLLAKKQARARDQSVTPEDNEMDVDEGDEPPPLVVIEPEPQKQPRKKKKPARKSRIQKQRLPRNKSLYAMRALQASAKPIFASLTMHRIVKTLTRKVLCRPDVKYSKQAMQFLMRIVESLMHERLLFAQAICLQGGRKTLMLHHLLTAEHHMRSPNLSQWVVEDFKQEDARLERSRFRNSRLGQL
jgi:histone H3/H4